MLGLLSSFLVFRKRPRIRRRKPAVVAAVIEESCVSRAVLPWAALRQEVVGCVVSVAGAGTGELSNRLAESQRSGLY